jgi:hypothetical protein
MIHSGKLHIPMKSINVDFDLHVMFETMVVLNASSFAIP